MKPRASRIRLISTRMGRRYLEVLDAAGLRPTPDRLRETLFNWINLEIEGAHVLDMYAGTGALGFECAVRGAKNIVLFEQNPRVHQALCDNAKRLGLNAHCCMGDAILLLDKTIGCFDLVFIDPPYGQNLWQSALDALLKGGHIAPGALVYIEGNRPLDAMLDGPTRAQFVLQKEQTAGQIYAYLLKF